MSTDNIEVEAEPAAPLDEQTAIALYQIRLASLDRALQEKSEGSEDTIRIAKRFYRFLTQGE